MLPEHTYAVLTVDMPEHGLKSGDVGVIVHIYPTNAYELEFPHTGDLTITVEENQVRARDDRNEVLHVRPLTAG